MNEVLTVLLRKKCVILMVCLLLQACGLVDDYLLGKDNTPKPATLPIIKSRLTLVQQWSLSLGKSRPYNHALKLKPVVSGDTLYIAQSNGRVLAIDKDTGTIRWSTSLKQELVSGPVVSHGVIALGTAAAGLVLLNQTDGQERWHLNVSGDVLSSPLIRHGCVIAKTIDGHLYAFDLKTGKKQW